MAKYFVRVTETYHKMIVVTADNANEAYNKCFEALTDPSADEWKAVTFDNDRDCSEYDFEVRRKIVKPIENEDMYDHLD